MMDGCDLGLQGPLWGSTELPAFGDQLIHLTFANHHHLPSGVRWLIIVSRLRVCGGVCVGAGFAGCVGGCGPCGMAWCGMVWGGLCGVGRVHYLGVHRTTRLAKQREHGFI